MRTLNLGILAHVDAGKTTLTERLLFTAGAIDHVGSVDAGTTQTDSLELERERGITIRSAVASFLVGDLAVNLVDTPGHPDFIAEVERVLGVLDGAVLVVSAVEGVQPQTPLLFRALQRLRVPTLIFVNKIDRAGADPERVVEAMARRLSPGVVPMGTRPRRRAVATATFVPFTADDEAHRTAPHRGRSPSTTRRSCGAYVGDETALSYRAPARAARPSRPGAAASTRCTSARRRTGIGIDALLAGIDELLGGARGDPDARRLGPRVQDRAHDLGRARRLRRACSPARCGRASACASGEGRRRSRPRSGCSRRPARRGATSVAAGEMATIRGLGAVRVGDAIGEPPPGEDDDGPLPAPDARGRRRSPRRPEQQGSLRAALAQLAEQDPLIDVRQDDHRHEIAVSLYGEVQKEVIQATLERDYGIAADFRETTTVCIERPARVGEAEEVIRAKTKTNITGRSSPLSTNPFMATLACGSSPRRSAPGIEFRARRRAPPRPALPVQDARDVRDPDGGVRPRGADRGPGRLAGDRLPGHDDRLRLRLAGHVARPTSGG